MLLYKKIFGIAILICLVCIPPVTSYSIGTSNNYSQNSHIKHNSYIDKTLKNLKSPKMAIKSDIKNSIQQDIPKTKILKNDPVQNAEILGKISPVSAAEILNNMHPVSAAEILNNMDPFLITLILFKMDRNSAAKILIEISPVSAAEILNNMKTTAATDILTHMSSKSTSAIVEILSNMNPNRANEILDDMTYDQNDNVSSYLTLSLLQSQMA
jgi:flagellar motility protein MotE (MotC chaperone)